MRYEIWRRSGNGDIYTIASFATEYHAREFTLKILSGQDYEIIDTKRGKEL